MCTTVLAIALYLTTAFSFSALQLWAPTRFALVVALRDRWRDWQDERARKRQQKELEKRRAEKPVVTTQLVAARAAATRGETARRSNDGESAQEIPGVPVSYTHLDVYKRQAPFLASAWNPTSTARSTIRSPANPEPVSYTHLDVYKRQYPTLPMHG